MKILLFSIISTTFANYIFDSADGLLFQENEDIWVYDAAVPVDINILLDSPREKFRQTFNADCGEDYLVEKQPGNLFGRNDTDMNETTTDCLTAFRTFDQVILSFLGEDLVTTTQYENENRKQRNKLFREKFEREEAEYQRKTKILEQGYLDRSRRNAAIAGGLTVAGTLGYTVAVDAKSRSSI